MKLTLLIAFFAAAVYSLRGMPKVVRYLTYQFKKLIRSAGGHSLGLIAITFTGTIAISLFCFVLYKVSCSIWAYCISSNLVEQFILSRGVFTIESSSQYPFRIKSLLSLIGMIVFQFGAAYCLYNGIGTFMKNVNGRLDKKAFALGDQILFSFIGVALFMVMDVVFFAQDIPFFSKVGNITLLIISRLSLISYFVCIVHVRQLSNNNYFNQLKKYLSLKPKISAILQSPLKTLFVSFLFALIFHFPAYLGLQFLENNLFLSILILLLAFVFSKFAFSGLFKGILDVLARILMLPDFGQGNLQPLRVLSLKKWIWAAPISLLIIISIIRTPGLISFYIVIGFGVISLSIAIYGIFLLIFSFIFWVVSKNRITNSALILEDTKSKIKSGFIIALTGLSMLHQSIKPGYWLIVLLTGLISAFPKPYPNVESAYSTSLIDEEGYIIYQTKSEEGFDCVPVVGPSIPPSFRTALILQEDRGLMKQRRWLPNRHNWFGISFSAVKRFIANNGGGSNCNMQLVKNETFKGKPVQDFQRKIYEFIASYQVALSFKPEEVLSYYVNRVPMFGGKEFKGLYMASINAFGIPPNELNEMQSLLLVRSLKYGRLMPLGEGRWIPYDELHQYESTVKNSLLDIYDLWARQGKISQLDYNRTARQELNLIGQGHSKIEKGTTKEFLRKQIPETPGTYQSTISSSNQDAIARAIVGFEKKLGPWMTHGDHNLYHASLVIDTRTGNIIGHHGGIGLSDLVDFGQGFQIGSLMKPFIIMELLEQGFRSEDIMLYDGKVNGRKTAQNYNRVYSEQWMGINKLIANSPNAPFDNLFQLTDPQELFVQNEARLSMLGISPDPGIELDNPQKVMHNQRNYPLGNRRMTLLEVTQGYQSILNNGRSKKPSVITSVRYHGEADFVDLLQAETQVFERRNALTVKEAMSATIDLSCDGCTGKSIARELTLNKTYYGKTGTSSNAIHGWTVLSDGNILIVSFATYGTTIGNHLELNNTPPIPYDSGGKTAGILSALIYNELADL